MPENFTHLKVDRFFSDKKYVYPKQVVTEFAIAQRNRNIHGRRILGALKEIKNQFKIKEDTQLPGNIVADDAIYIDFFSEWGYDFKFDSLTQDKFLPQKFQIVTIQKEEDEVDGEVKSRYRIVVMVREGGISELIKKVNQYIYDINRFGKPFNQPLFANLSKLQLASLESFWTDKPEFPFPQPAENIWWEVWFRRTMNEESLNRVIQNVDAIGAEIGQQTLYFPEHIVKLVRATADQLSGSLMLLDNLSELRKPQQLNDFITSPSVDIATKNEWVADLKGRLDMQKPLVYICLLDTGVMNNHPLLSGILPDQRLFTYKEPWGKGDTYPGGGHGTGMAGLALYGDLVEPLATADKIRILHGIESFKILHSPVANPPELYGSITEYACSMPIATDPESKRLFCLSITDGSLAKGGRPSTWSAALDKISFGSFLDPKAPHLFIVSGGNVEYLAGADAAALFPNRNEISSIHDPGQSYNALTVGAYTRMDRIDATVWPGTTPLATTGHMSPSNSTSLLWESQWPVKPDIVMEGGNLGVQGGIIVDGIHTMMPLSLDKDPAMLLYPFGNTSGAAALASKMAAELMTRYPDLWPETIRGLMVHSAEWTDNMLGGIDFLTAPKTAKNHLLRRFGYGVPIPEKAFYNAQNAVTLIAENELRPYKLEDGVAKYNQYHLYELPWPADILLNEVGEQDAKVTVTLSYFIEPNPGSKRYASSYRYYSHALDFKMIKRTESVVEFERRVSAAAASEEAEYHGEEEPWALKESVRNRGSIKKDFLVTSGADLATRHVLAVYPKSGWYKTRKKFVDRVNSKVRYSLIVSIETNRVDIEIYNPVIELLKAKLPVLVPIPISVSGDGK